MSAKTCDYAPGASLLIAVLLLGAPQRAFSQLGAATGLEVGGLPAVNYDADEGFGYGAQAEIYQYGVGDYKPYYWTLQPKVFLTTGGRRDVTLFFDAPRLLPEGWRVDGFLGIEKRITTPFYGLGNETIYDETLEDPEGANPQFYAFGRLRRSALFNLQHPVAGSPLRWLFGAGLVTTRIDPVPEQVGTTLYAREAGADRQTYWTNYVRGGLVWDTRDRETGPREGTWTELLVQRVEESLGADVSYTVWTFTDRRYFSLTDRLVFAHRYLLQTVSGDAPLYALQRVESSFKQGEGLGGSKTVRGVLKNRFTGRAMLVWNSELRLHVVDFRFIGRPFHAVVSGFLDQGRVWRGGVQPEELFRDLHRGYGVGVHVGMGENLVASFDVGTSSETGLPAYISLGYLY